MTYFGYNVVAPQSVVNNVHLCAGCIGCVESFSSQTSAHGCLCCVVVELGLGQ